MKLMQERARRAHGLRGRWLCRRGRHEWVEVYLQETDDFSVPWWGCDREGCMVQIPYCTLWPRPEKFRVVHVDMKHWWFK